PRLQQPPHSWNQARALFLLLTRAMRSSRPRRPGRSVISACVPGMSLRPLRNAPATRPLRRLASAASRWADSVNLSAFEKSLLLPRKLSELEAGCLAKLPAAHRRRGGLVGDIAWEQPPFRHFEFHSLRLALSKDGQADLAAKRLRAASLLSHHRNAARRGDIAGAPRRRDRGLGDDGQRPGRGR